MCALRAVLGLLLLETLQAFPKDRLLKTPCSGDPSYYPGEAVGSCCYRCPSGRSPTQPCPQGPAHCRKQCGPDYYVNENGRCTACVSCLRDLVEKVPCSWNSSRVCECRPGMYCSTQAANSCARCSPHSTCPTGKVVKFPGTAEKDTECEWPSPGTRSDCTNPEDCEILTRATPQATPTPVTASIRIMQPGEGIHLSQEDTTGLLRAPKSPSSPERKPGPDPGLSLPPLCLQGPANCRPPCEPDYYLDEAGLCRACASCSRDDLVEKAPCSWNSSRVCECRPGMFCATPATNSCAHCIAHPAFPLETIIRPQGMVDIDTTLELPPPGTLLDYSTPGNSEAPASISSTQSFPVDTQTIRKQPTSTVSPFSTGTPFLDSGPAFFWVTVVLPLVVVVGSSLLLLCPWKACRKRFRQKLHLYYPAQTSRPKLEQADSIPTGKLTQLKRSGSVTEPSTNQLSSVSPPTVETCASVGAACLESLPLLDDGQAGIPLAPRDPPEPRVSTEHTNNRIEKIYIMKADTVIVGTVKTEVPEGRVPVGSAGPELEAELEVDYVPHYPEQETEPPLDSCTDVMFSVEEEGKKDHWPTTVSEK
ncbi:tumor necrosis factor receptor superfamily member 8 isoform X2 [Nannospalax galili]|uniref:tumor necrosis factor receptor superfamily member 8 isoform X2 n=1 Tax=Nannospalax galili TaxID=1026970 RepID=UPI00111BE070|nr:tumor necrosis factor receptor superfamily member 8 isoform X2 [Nannospalax galili]